MKRYNKILALMSALLSLIGLVSAANTLCVTPSGSGGCYSSIQDAVDNAADGDTIRVAEGYYTETIEIDVGVILEGGWNTAFSERNWETHVTTIDANRTGCVIRVLPQVYVTIDGFVIKGGDSTSPLGWGGGIWVGNSGESEGLTIIRNNVITDNIASNTPSGQGHGGGILVYNNAIHVENNKINYNIAQNGAGKGGEGGGIHVGWMGSAVIIGNDITTNTTAISPSGGWEGKGGGIYVYQSDTVVEQNIIYGNVAAIDGPGKGGGSYASGSYTRNKISYNVASINGVGEGGGVYSNYTQYFDYNIIEYNIASKNDDGTGGGIYALQMQRCRRNHIIGNVANRGGGVYINSSSHTDFIRNTVEYNEATGTDDAKFDGGGGISTQDNTGLFLDNDIYNNTASYYGGGIQVFGGNGYTIKGNRIEGNEALSGGGISTRNGTGSIVENSLKNNYALFVGGGMHIIKTAAPTLDRNIIMENTASGFFAAGGGLAIALDASASITIKNHIIAKNAAGAGGLGGGIVFTLGILNLENCTIADNNTGTYKEGIALTSTDGAHTITNCIFKGHSTGVYLGGGTTCSIDYCDFFSNDSNYNLGTIGAHNLFNDPKFQDPAFGNYRLRNDSTLIDQAKGITGLNSDFEGDPRPHGPEMDIGADEYYGSEIFVSAIKGSDLTGTGSMGTPYASITKALEEVQTAGTVFVGRGSYLGVYDIERSTVLQGGYNETGWNRDIKQYTCLLDGQQLGTVVDIRGEDVEAVVEGFTILGGKASGDDSGSGVAIGYNANGIIRFNTIKDNVADDSGGGIMIFNDSGKDCVIDANNIFNNTALGIWNPLAPPSLKINQGAIGMGGGIIIHGGPATITNNFIHHNQAAKGGDGITVMNYQNSINITNNTISDNGEILGEGLRLDSTNQSRISMFNNFFVGHFKGLNIESAIGVEQDYNGYFDNFINIQGMAQGANDVIGDPCFSSRSSGDLHIRQCSSGLNQGLGEPSIAPDHDIDGDARPYGPEADIGADEMLGNSPPMFEFTLPSAQKHAAKDSFPITWIDDDVDNNASIGLYYDTDPSGIPGAVYIDGALENDPADRLDWDTSGIPEGIYWILAIVSDGINPAMYLYSPYPVKVTDITPEMMINHILDRGDIPPGRIPVADLNDDEGLNVADLIILLNLP